MCEIIGFDDAVVYVVAEDAFHFFALRAAAFGRHAGFLHYAAGCLVAVEVVAFYAVEV